MDSICQISHVGRSTGAGVHALRTVVTVHLAGETTRADAGGFVFGIYTVGHVVAVVAATATAGSVGLVGRVVPRVVRVVEPVFGKGVAAFDDVGSHDAGQREEDRDEAVFLRMQERRDGRVQSSGRII